MTVFPVRLSEKKSYFLKINPIAHEKARLT